MLSKVQLDAFSSQIQPLVTREAGFHARRYGLVQQQADIENEAWMGLIKMTQAESFSVIDAEHFCRENLGDNPEATGQYKYAVRRFVYNAARKFSRQRSQQAASFDEELEQPALPETTESRLHEIAQEAATLFDSYTDLSKGDRGALNLEVQRCLDLIDKTLENKERQALWRATDKISKREKDMTKRFLTSILAMISILCLSGNGNGMDHQGRHQIELQHQKFELHQGVGLHQALLAHQSRIRHQGGIGHQVFDAHQVGDQVFDLHQGGIA